MPVLILPRPASCLEIENRHVVVAAIAAESAIEVVGNGDAVDAPCAVMVPTTLSEVVSISRGFAPECATYRRWLLLSTYA